MINAETVASARLRREDLWTKAREAVSMLILGPEQLISKGFQDLLKHGPFFDRVCALGVDEIHLLVMWGISFRKAFTQIGFMRARFRSGIPIIGLTATLLDDPKPFIDGLSFPELAWVLKNNDKTLMFGATISLVFRIKTYLNSLLPPGVDRELRIRTYHSINWSDENIETISLFKSDARCQIIVATNGLAQGTDIPGVKTVIQIGEPESAEMFVQKPGRARPGIPNPRAIFYISATRHAKALKILS
ncbi:P-loop containing nucleoside triphosphate hydrolase protein, partial [Mycena olivaceomarginata]